MATNKFLTDLDITGNIQLDDTNVDNDSTVGIDLDINKENTSSAGFASNIYGIKSYSKGNSSETVVNIAGVWGKAEHIGTGRTYYITGGTNRAYHSGTGDSNAISGIFAEGKVGGTGTGSHEYVVGSNNIAKLDNANATVQYLQGQHCTVNLNAGTVSDNVMALILDIDNAGGTISGDLEYLRIQNDTLTSTVSGTARAINSLSTLPSEFAGSVQSPTFYLGSISSYIRNTSGDTELFSEAGLSIESADGMLIEISDVIDITGGGDVVMDGALTAASITKAGGTSSQFLKADGSVDSSTYLTSADVTSSQWDAATGGINYASGNVGIGTTSPQEKLDISAGDIRLDDNFSINWASDDANIGRVRITGNETPDTFLIVTDNQERLRVNNSGVGIGTNDPQAKLDVDGGIRMGNDTQTPASTNVGTMRYYEDALGSYVDMIMKTDTSTYAWVNIVRNIFSV